MSVHREANKAVDALALVLHQRPVVSGPRLPRVGAEKAVEQRKDEIRKQGPRALHALMPGGARAALPGVARPPLAGEQQRHNEEPLADDERRHVASASAVPERRLGGDGGADRSEHVLRAAARDTEAEFRSLSQL